ncbi:MAG: hypothetical protein SFZ02_17110 [bacterium]|nr:hypothetical protein [bacterium]
MRYLLICLMLIMLTACGGGEEPTAIPNTDAPPTVFVPQNTPVGIVEIAPENTTTIETLIAEEVSAQNPQPFVPTLAPVEEGGLAVPLAGTLVASQTEDPQAGSAFDYIYFVQEGGANNERIVIEIYSDGRTKRNDQEGTIGQDRIIEIIRAMDALNYFGLQGTFLGPAPRPDEYIYQIYIKRGANERLINAQDGYIPIEFVQFMSTIRNVVEIEATPEVTPTVEATPAS